MPQSPVSSQDRAVAAWLLACCALVFAMVVVGGITRLTHSGLSIVEWQPIVGTLPPLDDAQWAEAFHKYQATPEFRVRNRDMTLSGFKGIFWWEYFHRLLGRLVGVVFFVPLAYFVARGRVRGPLAWKLAGIFALGALQGAVGWYMVKSGLVDEPRVASLRLASHLGMALLIYGSMLWVALGLIEPRGMTASRGARIHAGFLAALVFVMVLTGALVAAIHAGLAYNTYPRMNGHWVPPEILSLAPWWRNFVYNMATVQFVHRVLAGLIVLTALALWMRLPRAGASERARIWSDVLVLAVAAQVAAGITTLLLRVPIPIAAIHQSGAVLVFTCALGVLHSVTRRP
ncbi:MAG TPA: COX15/CtaA family protein [Usitatibacter sp.]|jgi:cytochrome c oxidase assembly protein subunit 15|nr:COX15/CtaA family protein [Usitatibacter sp.]